MKADLSDQPSHIPEATAGLIFFQLSRERQCPQSPLVLEQASQRVQFQPLMAFLQVRQTFNSIVWGLPLQQSGFLQVIVSCSIQKLPQVELQTISNEPRATKNKQVDTILYVL